MRKIFRGALVVGLIAVAGEAVADDKVTNELLLKEIRELKARVQQLESQPSSAPKQNQRQDTDSAGELEALTAETPSANSATTAAQKVASANPKNDGSTSYLRDLASNTTVGGYASTEFENFQGADSTFDPHRFVLNIASQVHQRVKFYSEVELEHGATFGGESSGEGSISIQDANGNGVIDADEAQDIGVEVESESGRGGEIELEQAWAEFALNDNFGVRSGVILVPFGKFNLYHDDDLQNLTDRPLVSRRVIPTTWSDAGVGLVGQTELGEGAALGGQLYLINGLTDEFSAGAGGTRDGRGSLEQDNNNNKAVVGRLNFSPMLGQELGVSGYYGSYDDESNAIGAAAIDWDLAAGDFQLMGEAALFSFENGLTSDGAPVPNNIAGLYGELNYKFWFSALNQTLLGSSFTDPKLVASFRYNYAEVDRRGDLAELDEEGFVAGLAYRPVQNFVLKTEYQWNDGDLERKNADGFIGSIALGF